jgi:hypothetical protein
VKGGEAAFEVCDEIGGVFKACMDSEQRSIMRPRARGAAALRARFDAEAFKPAPGIAHPEMLEGIEKGGDLRLWRRLQQDAEKPRGA